MENEKRNMKKSTLSIRKIFRCMMESGYHPSYETTYLLFLLEDNFASVEYEDGIVSVRVFFSIDEELYDIFVEASNATMMETQCVKTVILEEHEGLMFSVEFPCSNSREFNRFIPTAVGKMKEALSFHKAEMRRLLIKNTESRNLPS